MQIFTPGETASAYRSSGGSMVVISNPTGIGIFHRASDQEPYTQCFGMEGTWGEGLSWFKASYIDPRAPKQPRRLDREEGSTDLTFNGEIYHLVDTPEEIEYQPLPTTRDPIWIYRLADGRVLYPSEQKFDHFWPMGQSRIYLGTGDHMVRLTNPRILLGTRLGNDRFETDEGIYFLLTNIWVATDGEAFRGRLVSADAFDIVETEDGVTLTEKSPAAMG